ncbi:hypothetical protein CK203_095756 [Vitis vinifera]|uniref:Uncharacterized protein n=1 Tax=Vitis vinifera TaxID=29760 RepID=A0A438BQY4_VITVI|nr:hypothetical protein CK203_095756 [Vitis vinifera]
MSKWWLLLVHLWNANGDDAHHLSNKNMPTRFGLVACMVLLKIPWISYGNWDVDPSKVAAVGCLCVD